MLLALAVLASLALTGCGGGGDSAGSRTGRVAVFATDRLSDEFPQVWVTIFHVELIDAAGNATVVFDEPAGRRINVRSLRDASGQRFAFLGASTLGPDVYASVRVTVGSDVVLMVRESSIGQVVTIAGATAGGQTTVAFAFPVPRNLGGGDDDLVVDFDVANFVLVGDCLTMALREGDHGDLSDRDRHEGEDFTGVVSDLAGATPNFGFTLTVRPGASFPVVTSAETVIFNSNGSANPVLANGQVVEVRGKFDVAADHFVATEVKIEGQREDERPEIRGQAAAVNAEAGTLVLTVREVEGFLPARPSINVATTDQTLYRAEGGVRLTAVQFFAALAAGGQVEVQGTYDNGTNTFTAVRAKLEDEDDDQPGAHEVEARGTATAINAAVGTFGLINLTEWEGFVRPAGTLNVTTGAGTRFRGTANEVLTAEAFFAALPGTLTVKVEGSFSGDAIAAHEVRLTSGGNGS